MTGLLAAWAGLGLLALTYRLTRPVWAFIEGKLP